MSRTGRGLCRRRRTGLEARREAAQWAGNHGYTQIQEQAADHFFTDRYDDLKTHVSNWLMATALK